MYLGAFQNEGYLCGVPITRTIVFAGLEWGPPIWGNYHLRHSVFLRGSDRSASGGCTRNIRCLLPSTCKNYATYKQQIPGLRPWGLTQPRISEQQALDPKSLMLIRNAVKGSRVLPIRSYP